MEALGIRIDQIVFQIINFAIVFIVLSKFVYKPVLEFIKKQKKELGELDALAEESAKQKQDIEKLKQDAAVSAQKMQEQTLEKAQSEAYKIIEGAKKTANAEGKRILQEYNEEAMQTQQAMVAKSKDEIYKQALKKTEDLLKTSITPAQQNKLMELSLERLQND
jgi:F-type H+-transporting ATPase subunit b